MTAILVLAGLTLVVPVGAMSEMGLRACSLRRRHVRREWAAVTLGTGFRASNRRFGDAAADLTAAFVGGWDG